MATQSGDQGEEDKSLLAFLGRLIDKLVAKGRQEGASEDKINDDLKPFVDSALNLGKHNKDKGSGSGSEHE